MNDNEDIIHKVFLKPSYDTRTFETRLLFIKNLFDHTFSRSDIMGRCILYKLESTYETYKKEVDKSSEKLIDSNPVTILNKLSKLD